MLVKTTELSTYNGFLRPVKGQEAAPHSVAKYLHKPAAGSIATSSWFIFDLETQSQFLDTNANVVKVVFDNSPIGAKILQDLTAGSNRIIDETGKSIKPLQGYYAEIMYGAAYDIHFNDPAGKPVVAKAKASEMQFLFKNESIANITNATQERIAKQPTRYVLSQKVNDNDIDAALQTQLDEPTA